MPLAPVSPELKDEGVPAGVRRAVLSALGRPPDLVLVDVRPLWGDHFRVNVLVGPNPTAVSIAHSYFVTADDIGRVTQAVPPLTRAY